MKAWLSEIAARRTRQIITSNTSSYDTGKHVPDNLICRLGLSKAIVIDGAM